MAVLIAVVVVLLIVVLIDLALTAGIIRQLRVRNAGNNNAGMSATHPRPGHRVDLSKDRAAWPPEAADMLSGLALAAFVLPHCPACDRLHREIDAAQRLPVRYYVIGDATISEPDVVHDYLGSWQGARAQLVSPTAFDTLESFDRPRTFPTIVLLRDGVVVASGHRLDGVTAVMDELDIGAAV